MGAPVGNKNAAKAKVWTAAIERALERRVTDRRAALDELADKLLDMCAEGDLAALKELGDRLEGKPTQIIAGDEEAPVVLRGVIDLVRPG
jgi:hypothetical protein